MRLLVLVLLFCSTTLAGVKTVRVPDGGIEPQAVTDAKGVIHLIFFKGADKAGDIYYTTSADGGATFGKAIRVNSEPNSAMATGSIRGGQLAIGREGRVHVAWMGSFSAKPKAGTGQTPMLYTRLAADGKSFEPQKNVIAEHVGMDGGGSVAADAAGNVYVAWHAPSKKDGDEATRKLWVARSTDDGKTFSPEVSASGDIEGACACCSVKVFVGGKGEVIALFRRATNMTDRATVLARSTDGGKTFSAKPIDEMKSGKCLMSSYSVVKTPAGYAYGVENNGEVRLIRDDARGQSVRRPGEGKYPALAINAAGQVLVAWAVGTGWNKGGTIAWEVRKVDGQVGEQGDAKGLPVWSYPAAVALPDGNFVIVY